MITRSDESLLREYCSGSEDAFRELAQRYGAIVYAACLKSLGRAEMAEDAAQAVFLVLARKADRLRVKTTLIPWLLTTSRVVSRNYARNERRRLRFEQPLDKDIATTEDSTDHSIFEALDKLRGPDREAIVLRFVQGMSLVEVGRLQGISEDAARMRVNRGISRLRKDFVPSAVLSPSLLARLANPKAASALIQQLALKSTAMSITTSATFAAVVGISGIGIFGAGSLYRTHARVTNQSTPHAVGFPSQTKPGATLATVVPQVPALPAPFTLTYRVISKDEPLGTRYVTISSEGSDLLVMEEDRRTDPPTISYSLNRDRRSYNFLHAGAPGTHSNTWVTESLVIEPFPFVGANLPTIHPLVEMTGPDDRTGSVSKYAAKVYEKGLRGELPFVTGECSIVDLAKGVQAVSSIFLGKDGSPARVWNLGGIKQWNGVPLASVVSDTTYDRSKSAHGNTVFNWKRFILQSKQSVALPAELFVPERHLQEGDHVEFKIPKQAKMDLNFTYHDNGTTIEEQANAQDRLEVRAQQGGR